MSAHHNHHFGGRLNRLYRDRDNGVFFGVCAGVADYFDVNVLAVRIGFIIGLLVAFTPVALVYVVAVLLLKDRSLGSRRPADERSFWRSGSDYGQ